MDRLSDTARRAWAADLAADFSLNFSVWSESRCWECEVGPLMNGEPTYAVKEFLVDGDYKTELVAYHTPLEPSDMPREIVRALALVALQIDPDAAREALEEMTDAT